MNDVESVAIAIAREAGVDVVAWLNGKWSPPGHRSESDSNDKRKPPSPSPPKTEERGQSKNQSYEETISRFVAMMRDASKRTH